MQTLTRNIPKSGEDIASSLERGLSLRLHLDLSGSDGYFSEKDSRELFITREDVDWTKQSSLKRRKQ